MRHVSVRRCDNYVRFPVYYSNAPLKTPVGTKQNKLARRGIVTMKKRRILLIEDEQDIAELVSLHLRDVCDELLSLPMALKACASRRQRAGRW